MTDIVLFQAQQLAKRTARAHTHTCQFHKCGTAAVRIQRNGFPSAEHCGHPPLSTHVRTPPRFRFGGGEDAAKKKKKSSNHTKHLGRLSEFRSSSPSFIPNIFPRFTFSLSPSRFERRNANPAFDEPGQRTGGRGRGKKSLLPRAPTVDLLLIPTEN